MASQIRSPRQRVQLMPEPTTVVGAEDAAECLSQASLKFSLWVPISQSLGIRSTLD